MAGGSVKSHQRAELHRDGPVAAWEDSQVAIPTRLPIHKSSFLPRRNYALSANH